jgi:hypothetical protein
VSLTQRNLAVEYFTLNGRIKRYLLQCTLLKFNVHCICKVSASMDFCIEDASLGNQVARDHQVLQERSSFTLNIACNTFCSQRIPKKMPDMHNWKPITYRRGLNVLFSGYASLDRQSAQ